MTWDAYYRCRQDGRKVCIMQTFRTLWKALIWVYQILDKYGATASIHIERRPL